MVADSQRIATFNAVGDTDVSDVLTSIDATEAKGDFTILR